MAVRLVGNVRRYIGLSKDEKPYIGQRVVFDDGTAVVLSAADLPPGSSFLESDTGHISRFDGVRWSAPVYPDGYSAAALEAILQQLGQIRDLLESALI